MTHFTAEHPLSGGCSASQEPDTVGDQLRFILKEADSCYCVKHVLLTGHSSPSGRGRRRGREGAKDVLGASLDTCTPARSSEDRWGHPGCGQL